MTQPSTLERIRTAHARSGAPGAVVGYWSHGYYKVELQYGEREFRFYTHGVGDPRVTVKPSWSIAGDRQRKQATA